MNAAPDAFASAGESQADVPAIDDSQTKKFVQLHANRLDVKDIEEILIAV